MEHLKPFMEHTKRTGMLSIHAIVTVILAASLVAPFRMFGAGVSANPAVGPTVENALAADDSLAKAIRDNDADGIASWLDKD
jgi:hypothetical protein